METNSSARLLTCVLFPGVVQNEEKAIQCLGGIRSISQVYSQTNKKRLGLNFQPENPFMKKIYADACNSAGLLLKVKIKKSKDDNVIKKEVVSTTVVGRVKTLFVFQSMCDFQYLPVHSEGTAPKQCLMESLIPSGMDNWEVMLDPAPVFIIPPKFTRFDKPTNYCYTDKRYLTERKIVENDDSQVHHKIRLDRAVPSSRYTFNLVDNFPTEPNEYHLSFRDEKIKVFQNLQQEFETVKKLFEERPIWSANLIRYHTKIRIASMKIILPCLSYYMRTGPWRTTWVRHGYDPRKEPGARIYQTLDFRLRSTTGLLSLVATRDQTAHYKKADRVSHIKKKRTNTSEDEPTVTELVAENTVYYKPGMVPGQRQIFYQFCDIKLPEVEELLSTEPAPGHLCHLQRGWLPDHASEFARDCIYKYARKHFIDNQAAIMKLEQGSSESESDSGDEGASSSAMEVDESFNT